MAAIMFGETQLDCVCKTLTNKIGALVNVPAILNEPILKVIKRQFIAQKTNQFISQFAVCKHDG